MNNHYNKLHQIKPTMSMRGGKNRSRRQTVDAYKEYWENNEVYYAFKKVRETTGGTDCKCPKTHKLAAKLSSRKVKKGRNCYDEHRSNVSNMLRRMG